MTREKAIELASSLATEDFDFSVNLILGVAHDWEGRIQDLAEFCHSRNKKWWTDLETGEPRARNVGELLMLAVSELAEAMEGHRKGLWDDKLPHLPMFDVEIADCLIRLFDLIEGMKLRVGQAFVEKSEYNLHRADHKIENRKAEGGKKY